MNLESKIEAILFFKAEPVSIRFLARMLEVNDADIKEALLRLEEDFKKRGVRLIIKDDEVMLSTAPELHSLVETITKAELSEELSRASLETLTLVLYRGPINKSNIDFIRGVNSQFILRNLLVRGLVERISDEHDKRILLYRPTFELLQHLGTSRVSELPEYDMVQKEVMEFEKTFQREDEHATPSS
ncbi:MAG: SMC-Scp complex subunit ScpB [bacterium]|nr:SMC-Scp complex subunit ScpB [bacterium]